MQKLIMLFIFWNSFFNLQAQNSCFCNDYLLLKNDPKIEEEEIIKRLVSKKGICKAKGYELWADHLESEVKLDSALEVILIAEKLYLKSACSDTILLNTYKILAQIYYSNADFVNAQTYSLKMSKCAEKAGNFFEQALGYSMIAQLFNQTDQASTGIKYTNRAAQLLSKIEKDKISTILSILSSRYLWHFQDTKTQGSLDLSELYARQYLSLAKIQQDTLKINRALNKLQGVSYERKDYKKAMILLDSAAIYLNENDYEGLRLHYYDKADILIELDDLNKAQVSADSALYYLSFLKNPSFLADGYELKERIAFAKGDIKQAYEMNKLKSIINDSIRNVEKIEAVSELEKKYSQVKNENIIKDLDRKNQFYLLISLCAFLGLVAFGFYLRQQKLKHKQNILETEQRLNRARMNPHFFFNALSSLQKFALADHDGQALASNLSKFSNIMRETLESTYKDYITVEQEMDFLHEYLEVQKMRFPNTFSFNIQATNDMEINDILIPSMILQPFIENSIEHGFSGIDHNGHVDIFFKVENDELKVEIIDNGKGLNTAVKEKNEHISRAGQILKDRIYLLNIKLKSKAGFSIDNNNDGKGTIVKIHLPLLYQS